jgi:hypothetical protein
MYGATLMDGLLSTVEEMELAAELLGINADAPGPIPRVLLRHKLRCLHPT